MGYLLIVIRCVPRTLGLGFSAFARRYLRNTPPSGGLFFVPLGTEMFHFPRCALVSLRTKVIEVCSIGFSHSDISGSQVATHLPEAYRSYATSFIAMWCQGIHHLPLLVHSVRLTILPGIATGDYCVGRTFLMPSFLRCIKADTGGFSIMYQHNREKMRI